MPPFESAIGTFLFELLLGHDTRMSLGFSIGRSMCFALVSDMMSTASLKVAH